MWLLIVAGLALTTPFLGVYALQFYYRPFSFAVRSRPVGRAHHTLLVGRACFSPHARHAHRLSSLSGLSAVLAGRLCLSVSHRPAAVTAAVSQHCNLAWVSEWKIRAPKRRCDWKILRKMWDERIYVENYSDLSELMALVAVLRQSLVPNHQLRARNSP